MQQYFSEVELRLGSDYVLTKEQAHHARDVMRMDGDKIRLVHEDRAFFASLRMDGGMVVAHIEEEDFRQTEASLQLTLAMALIRREKFELVLQKATELGVNRIIPFVSQHCVVQEKKEKAARQMERWHQILVEAARQCKRNKVPLISGIVPFTDLGEYCSMVNLACYENAGSTASLISDHIDGISSATVVVGPEGGFSFNEVEWLKEHGFACVTLGPRILRAETAAIYACAIVAERGLQ